MNPTILVEMFGSLRRDYPQRDRLPITLPIQPPVTVAQVLDRLSLADGVVQLVMVNHKAVTADKALESGDRMALFPREYPIFVDWKDYRTMG